MNIDELVKAVEAGTCYEHFFYNEHGNGCHWSKSRCPYCEIERLKEHNEKLEGVLNEIDINYSNLHTENERLKEENQILTDLLRRTEVTYIAELEAKLSRYAKENTSDLAPIPYSENYWIDTQGEVYRLLDDGTYIIAKKHINSEGYYRISFRDDNNRLHFKFIQRLVLESFIGACPEGKEASHLNGISTDNRLCNLAWETKKENMQRKKEHAIYRLSTNNLSKRLTAQQVLEIKELLSSGVKSKDIADRYGVNFQSISKIKRGKSWKKI